MLRRNGPVVKSVNVRVYVQDFAMEPQNAEFNKKVKFGLFADRGAIK